MSTINTDSTQFVARHNWIAAETTRRFPRSEQEAFRNYTESCLGVERPIDIGPRPLWWRILRLIGVIQ